MLRKKVPWGFWANLVDIKQIELLKERMKIYEIKDKFFKWNEIKTREKKNISFSGYLINYEFIQFNPIKLRFTFPKIQYFVSKKSHKEKKCHWVIMREKIL